MRRAGLPPRWLPSQGTGAEARRYDARRRALMRGDIDLTWPQMTELDEFPQVPFLFGPDGENLYDSSAIGAWFAEHPNATTHARALLPDGDPALRFAIRLIDEALDELGLYMVHHNRWVIAARDNVAGVTLSRAMRPLMGPAAMGLRALFPARQARRLPYLFSVAAPDDAEWNDLPARLRPPARRGFPPTHVLLQECFSDLLAVLEPLLASRPFLFGSSFTLGDASVYGELGMNMADPAARAWIARDAPVTEAGVQRIARGEVGVADEDGGGSDGNRLDESVAPLLGWACRCFVPLMQQNLDAWRRHTEAGETLFNEKAFNRARALYDGELCGHPYRSVVKTFQVKVWQALRADWEALEVGDRARLEALLPSDHGLGRDAIPTPIA